MKFKITIEFESESLIGSETTEEILQDIKDIVEADFYADNIEIKHERV